MKLGLREIVVITSGFLGAAAGPCIADTFMIDYSTVVAGTETDTIVPWDGSTLFQPQQFFTPVGTTLNIGISIIDTTQTPYLWETRYSGPPPDPAYSGGSICGPASGYSSCGFSVSFSPSAAITYPEWVLNTVEVIGVDCPVGQPCYSFAIDSIQVAIIGTGTTTPLPAALPLFATGLAGLGLFGWRRKRTI
jgi:hypothetical protein